MLSRLSIRSKIISVVLLLFLMMSAMGGMSVGQMREINRAAHDIETNWMASVQSLAEIQSGVMRYRLLVRDYLLSESDEERSKIEAGLGSLESRNASARTAYEPLISSAEERGLYDRYRQPWSSYVRASQNMIAAERGRDKAKAKEIFTNNMSPLAIEAERFLEQDMRLNSAGAKEAGLKASSEYTFGLAVVLALAGISLVSGFVLSWLLVRNVSNGIASVVMPMEALSRGDLGAAIPAHHPNTEIGTIAETLHVFKDALISKKAADEEAAADAEAKIQRGQRVDRITHDFETLIGQMVESLSSSSTELEGAAKTLTMTAETTGKISGSAATASQEVSSNVQSVAIATEEITSSVAEISRQVQESSRIANDAVRQAQKTDASIAELSQAAARIGDVVKLITAVAEQTNLLALNATIEAARAGDAGRGFAVVASEVKALAAQTAKATDEISSQIAGMQAATQESVATIKEIGSTINTISEISSSIAAAVEEQGAATQEIARNVQYAAQRSGEVASSITDVSRGAGETGAASGQVLSSAQMLSRESSRLRTEVEKFLSSVRAA